MVLKRSWGEAKRPAEFDWGDPSWGEEESNDGWGGGGLKRTNLSPFSSLTGKEAMGEGRE